MIGQKIKIYPTNDQKQTLDEMFKFANHAYNKMLEYWNTCYKEYKAGNLATSPYEYFVRDWYKANKEQEYSNMTNMIIDNEAHHLSNAFKRFFNKISKHPKFKNEKYSSKWSFTLDARNASICAVKDKRVKINKNLRIKMSEDFKYQNPKIFTISKHFDEYYISICFDDGPIINQIKTNKYCGIDLGLKTNVMLYDCDQNICKYDQDKKKIKRFQNSVAYYDKRLSRKTKGSKSFLKMLKNKHQKLINRQNRNDDFYNKVALDIVKAYDVIGIEDLNVAGLKKNKHLSKSWNSATIGRFEMKLANKAAQYGKTIVKVGRTFPSSQLCSCCGARQKMPLFKRTYKCSCGMVMDRDVNAAKNIMQEANKIYMSQNNTMKGKL